MNARDWELPVITEIQHTTRIFFDCWLKYRDIKRVKHYLSEEICIVFSEKNNINQGFSEIVNILQKDLTMQPEPVDFSFDTLQIIPHTQSSVTLVLQMKLKTKPAPEMFISGMQTISILWMKNLDKWKATHLHFSASLKISRNDTLKKHQYNIQKLEGMIDGFNNDLAKARKEIQQLKQQTRHLQNEVELAQKASETKNLFVANMSHELRTPVTGIIGMSEILSRKNLTPEQNGDLKVIIDSSRALLGLISDMMDISRIEAGQLQIRNEAFSIKDLLNNIQTLSNPMAINKKNKLILKTADDIPEVILADKYRLEQVVMNLVNNAMKFTCEGTITVEICRAYKHDSSLLKILVSDTGIGIKSESQGKLFRQFQQLDEPGQENSGTGLGLYICKELVTLMGGEISLESRQGKGSTFWFTFKIAQVEPKPQTIMPALEEEDMWDLALGLNILLVDDKSVNQKVISLMLETAQCKVDIAKNGLEALDIYKPEEHQVILMDIMMPVMDGITSMKEIRKKHPCPCPIIAITANAMQGDEEKYLSMGFDAYIAKPVTMLKLVSHLKDMGIMSR